MIHKLSCEPSGNKFL